MSFGFSAGLNTGSSGGIKLGGGMVGGIGGGIGGSIGGGLNINLGGGTTVHRTTTITTTSVNQGNSLELSIKAQYEEKLKGWEIKYNDCRSQIEDLTQKLRNAESLNIENQKKWENEKNSLQFHIHRIRTERNQKVAEISKWEQEYNVIQGKYTTTNKLVVEFELTIKNLNERIARHEDESIKKKQKLQEIENDLLRAQNTITFENKDDLEYEGQIKMQKETILKMQNEIRGWIEENNRDDEKIAIYENELKQKDEQIALLRQQIHEIKTTYTSNTHIELSQIINCDVYIQLDNKYTLLITENQGIMNQLELKNNLIRDLEGRLKTEQQSNSTLSKTVNELRLQISSLEEKELDYKRSIDDYSLQLNQVTISISMSASKLGTLETLIRVKDEKIASLYETIKERDIALADIKFSIKEKTDELTNTRIMLESKLREISGWKQEDERDNEQIRLLLEAVESQNKTIKDWEEENRRDDTQIAFLKSENEKLTKTIDQYRDWFTQLKNQFISYSCYASEFQLLDSELTQKNIVSFRQEVENSSAYLSVKASLESSEETIKALQKDIFNYRSELQEVIKEKNLIIAECESLRREISLQTKQVENAFAIKAELDLKIQRQVNSMESTTSTMITATQKVDDFKNGMGSRYHEIEKIFTAYHEYVAN